MEYKEVKLKEGTAIAFPQVESISINGLYCLEVDENPKEYEFMVVGRVVYIGGKWDQRRKWVVQVQWNERGIMCRYTINTKIRPLYIPIIA